LDNVAGISQNIKKNKMAFAKYAKANSKKNGFKKAYYASLINNAHIKNDISLEKNLTITGPNASGKTTILKTTLINVLLSQQMGCGFYKSANLVPYKHIHCYLNIPDTSGRDSLFQAEARRCKEILDVVHENKKDTHFCVFDELYSGTNPDEAVTSSLGFMEYLVKFPNVKCLLTTHFFRVCKTLGSSKKIENYHMETKMTKDGDDFTYTYLLKRGISEVKGGLKVLQDLSYPEEILRRREGSGEPNK
jgi:DNA mismatch repair ATPase MutS